MHNTTNISEWLANLKIGYVIAIIIVLLIARFILGKRNSEAAKSAAEFTESILIAVTLVFLIIRPFIVQAFYIPSPSMVPTLEVSDHILVNKFVYRFQNPQHGDIVVFKSPAEANAAEADFIKRLIGLPGDVLQVKIEGNDYDEISHSLVPSGTLYRNGKRIEEPYLNEPHHIKCSPYASIDLTKPYTVPQGRLLVMGDNRNNSNDSRFWGALDRNRIVGKAMVRFFPINRVGLLH